MEYELTAPKIVQALRALFFVLAPLLFLLYKTKKDSKVAKKLDSFRGPVSLPIVGTTYQILSMGGLVDIFNTICYKFIKDYGRLFRVWMFNYPQVVVASAKDAEKILHSMQHNAKSFNYRLLYPWLGRGLVTLKDHTWKIHRKILTPAFHFNILHEFMHIFNKNAGILSDKFGEVSKNGKEFNVVDLISLCTMDIINESSMGDKVNAQIQEDSPYVSAVKNLHKYLAQRYFSIPHRFTWIYNRSKLKMKMDSVLKTINDFADGVINNRRKYLHSIKNSDKSNSSDSGDSFGDEKKKLAFIDLLLMAENKDGKPLMSPSDIRDEVNTFMFGGHDTVTTAMSWTLFLLGSHPEIQEKVFEELNTVFGDSGREPTLADLSELKYLERCFKETLRLFPSIPFIERYIREDITLDCGRVIPAGCTVTFLLYVIHRDPEHFPCPEKFDPDRFLPENSKNRHPYAFLPFSAGPRNCIGQKFAMQEAKVILSTILRRFRVEAAQKLEDAVLEISLVLCPQNGLKIRLFERDSHPHLRVHQKE